MRISLGWKRDRESKRKIETRCLSTRLKEITDLCTIIRMVGTARKRNEVSTMSKGASMGWEDIQNEFDIVNRMSCRPVGLSTEFEKMKDELEMWKAKCNEQAHYIEGRNSVDSAVAIERDLYKKLYEQLLDKAV